ncbi:NADH-ubiquinone oxidoreductase subunit 6 [Raphidocelis subcapitata]|uniref:NADH-ubiquinone oxidoreductase subunit 6 n=1 Tax=Raphidocelis subcapitata TaxID=307507 RepID=A0A2V0NKI4_9CHLO|nr:NADH-ubiquinone oxidoreductase subunit 6 [Raphidocelis subcapitata]|eukprot:GBF87499.1 NADH-ubiquinone oxidoreductase subunit 6 [Raphidocelis subcapitata]
MAPPEKKRVAVIGSGISGLSSAWLLHRAGHHVTLYEAEERCGGHTLTADAAGVPVDLGFQVYNLTTYPHLVGFLEALGWTRNPEPFGNRGAQGQQGALSSRRGAQAAAGFAVLPCSASLPLLHVDAAGGVHLHSFCSRPRSRCHLCAGHLLVLQGRRRRRHGLREGRRRPHRQHRRRPQRDAAGLRVRLPRRPAAQPQPDAVDRAQLHRQRAGHQSGQRHQRRHRRRQEADQRAEAGAGDRPEQQHPHPRPERGVPRRADLPRAYPRQHPSRPAGHLPQPHPHLRCWLGCRPSGGSSSSRVLMAGGKRACAAAPQHNLLSCPCAARADGARALGCWHSSLSHMDAEGVTSSCRSSSTHLF